MKKYLLLMAAGIFGILTANAWSVSFSTNDEGKSVATITGSGSDSQNWSDDSFTASERTGIVNADILVFKGTINTLKPFDGAGCKATTVDFSDAYFPETPNGKGPYTFYEYNPSSNVSPKYKMVKTTQGETTTVSYVEASDGKYVKHENVYYKTNGMTFQYFKSCTNPILSTHVESICQNCINNMSQLKTTFTIPGNIKFIAAGAVDNTPITSITIPSSVEYIESGAIRNASTNALIDVTVESISTVCANGGFLKDITVGQTDAGYMNYAVLHFPPGAEEYFVNQEHELDLATSLDNGKFQAWLNGHYNSAGNGWQEFINSGPSNDIPITDPVVLRTFSDNVAHYVPLCYRAYIVNGIEGNSTDGYTLILQQTYAIPANTGVILYGEAKTGSLALPILSGASWTTPYDRNSGVVHVNNADVNLKNYLVANCKLPEGTKIGPYELGSDGKVAERNFVMGKYSKTDMAATDPISNGDYVAFFRTKTITPGKNKAHLKVPNSIYKEPKGVEFIAVNPNPTGKEAFRVTEWPRDHKQYGDWGTKPNNLAPFFAKSFGEPFEDETTAISNVTTENAEDAAIYTLQGVKVSNPTKGVYIQNGKKFIIK